jgi:hypothetical protein
LTFIGGSFVLNAKALFSGAVNTRLTEDGVNPRVRKLSAANSCHVFCVSAGLSVQAAQDVSCKLLRNDGDAVDVADEDVACVDYDPAHRHGIVDFARAAVEGADRRDTAREDREIGEGSYPRDVSHAAVDDKPRDLAVTCLGRDEVTEDRVERGSTGVHGDDVSGSRHVEALVDHQIVTGEDLDGARRSDDSEIRISEVVDPRIDRVEAVHEIRNLGSSVTAQAVEYDSIRYLEIVPNPKTGTGVEFS